jgi:hypothetical protein
MSARLGPARRTVGQMDVEHWSDENGQQEQDHAPRTADSAAISPLGQRPAGQKLTTVVNPVRCLTASKEGEIRRSPEIPTGSVDPDSGRLRLARRAPPGSGCTRWTRGPAGRRMRP